LITVIVKGIVIDLLCWHKRVLILKIKSMRTDLELQRDVIEELKWESSIKASDIGVSVTNSVVTLSGYVDSFTKKKAAEKAALRVAGVTAVAEDIVVRLGASDKKSDTEVAQAIITAIRWNNIIDENKIKVKVESGWVTLEGEVDWSFEKNAIEHSIENLIGVRGISNLITISSKLKTTDIKQKITAAFHRSATLDANNIIVESVGNTIILKGVVRSYAEKQDALRVAWNAPGVIKVDNKLIVDVPMLVN
jgi:osmotically-inducible protein OsmY